MAGSSSSKPKGVPPEDANVGETPDASGTVIRDSGSLTLANATLAWEWLTACVERFIGAWETQPEPPSIAAFVTVQDLALRRLALTELIKVDLEYRYRPGQPRKQIQEYLEEYPELEFEGLVPIDLIYEEYHIRRQSGEQVDPQAYLQRFPRQADELRRLLEIEVPNGTTTLMGGDRTTGINVGDQLDEFDLLTQLGRGAFATVFLARQRSMQRLVALKVSGDRGDEPRTMAQLDHPNIVRVYDQRVLADRKLRLLYMQYVAGGTLEEVVQAVRAVPLSRRTGALLLHAIDGVLTRRGESSPEESRLRERIASWSWPEVVCWLGARIAAALDYAHQRNVLHRDLKPANVLLSADGSPKLADFNISFCSKVDGANASAFFGGSLAYMSPEQLEAFHPSHARQADDLDGRADIYSLGIMLWELLTGCRPFTDHFHDGGWTKTVEALCERRREGFPKEAMKLVPPDCPPGMVEIIKRCLAPMPEQRYGTAGVLARQFELCLTPGAQRVLAPRTNAKHPFSHRHPLVSLLLHGVIAHVLASGLNVFFNYFEIIEGLQVSQETNSDIARSVFRKQIFVVNPIAYGLAIGIIIAFGLPILKSVKRSIVSPEDAAIKTSEVRRRCLWLGDFVALVSTVLWIASGIVFPVWLNQEGVQLSVLDSVYFLSSQVVYGLIAAALSFYCINQVTARSFYPSLVDTNVDDHEGYDGLTRFSWRLNAYLVTFPTVGFIALVAFVFLTSHKWALAVVAGFAFVGLMVAMALKAWIQRDVDSLVAIARPATDSTFSMSHTGGYWTKSR